MKNLLLLFLAVVLLTSCQKDNELLSPESLQADQISEMAQDEFVTYRNALVPFKANYVTYPSPYDPEVHELACDWPIPMFVISGNGNATHLGNSSWASTFQLTPKPDTFIPNGDIGFTQGYWHAGCHFFTAANGAILEGVYCGSITIEYLFGDDMTPIPIDGEGGGNFVITDANKNHDGTTGYGNYYVDLELVDFVLTGYLDFDGMLDKNGGDYTNDYCSNLF